MTSIKALLIDDDDRLAALLKDYFDQHQIELRHAGLPSKGLAALTAAAPDIVLVDVMLPEMDGFELCRRIRATSSVPILMLTARGEVTDRVLGLEMGADDYLAKPFEPRELVARMRAILRRKSDAPKASSRTLTSGAVIVIPDRYQVTLKGKARANGIGV